MAIIKCPECKNDVSEYANKCPNCGCPITVIKNNQIKNIETKVKDLERKNRKSIEAKEFQKVLDVTKIPKNKPRINVFLIIGAIIIIAVISFMVMMIGDIDGTLMFYSICLIIVGVIIFLIGCSSLKESQRMYEQLKDDPEEYRKQLALKYYHNIKSQENARERAKERKQSKIYTVSHVKCPYCNSTNTKKLSVTSKAGSVAMFGLMSNKVGKQWHCNSCGSDF